MYAGIEVELNHTSNSNHARMAIKTSTLVYPCRLPECAHSIRVFRAQLTEPRSSQQHLRKTDHRHYTQETTHDTVPCSERQNQKRDQGKEWWSGIVPHIIIFWLCVCVSANENRERRVIFIFAV